MASSILPFACVAGGRLNSQPATVSYQDACHRAARADCQYAGQDGAPPERDDLLPPRRHYGAEATDDNAQAAKIDEAAQRVN
nr:hypothetical protein [Rhodopila globiformis]